MFVIYVLDVVGNRVQSIDGNSSTGRSDTYNNDAVDTSICKISVHPECYF